MKIKTSLLLALLAASSLAAAPLSKTTAVHAKPNASSAAIAVLNAGAEPVLATSGEPAPAGWTAVELSGPHEVYVQSKDILKSLDVRPGASFYTAPKVDSAILTTMSKGDVAEISGLHGRWTQIKLQKKVIGYVGDDSVISPVMSASSAPSGVNASVNLAQRPGSAPAPVAASPVQVYTGPGQAAPAPAGAPATLSAVAAAALPRMFEGTFVPAKRFLAYKPFEHQLNDRAGERYAFLDVSRLSKADPVDKYMNRVVTVYGTAKAIENTKDIVIEVDSIQIH